MRGQSADSDMLRKLKLMREVERSDVLSPFYCAADGDPQRLCCVHSISSRTGAVVGS